MPPSNVGGYYTNSADIDGERLQGAGQPDDDGGGDMFPVNERINMNNLVGLYDAYSKLWIDKNTCGTLAANSGTSTTHCGTF